MRKTITLDEDVYLAVKEEMKSGEGKTFKESVNDLIRRGKYVNLSQSTMKQGKWPTFKMGGFPHLNYDKPREIIEEVEGPYYR